MNPYFYSEAMLPKGFRFPESYVEFISKDPFEDLDPWWFFYEYQDSADFWLDYMKKQYPDRSLIPFAKYGASDDVACFDGADRTGDPKVFYIHTFTSPGWEQRGTAANFSVWLERARQEAAEYEAEQAAGDLIE